MFIGGVRLGLRVFVGEECIESKIWLGLRVEPKIQLNRGVKASNFEIR